MSEVIGIKANGEQLRFERWVYMNWIHGNLRDPFLLNCLRSCVQFYYV